MAVPMLPFPVTPPTAPTSAEALVSLRANPPVNLSAKEAAAFIGISERLLHTETHRPGSALRPSKIGRRLVYRRATVERWLELKAIAD